MSVNAKRRPQTKNALRAVLRTRRRHNFGAPAIVPQVGRGLCFAPVTTYYYLGGLSAGPIEGSATRQLAGSRGLRSY